MYNQPHHPPTTQPPAAAYPGAQPVGVAYPPAQPSGAVQPAARPTALYILLGLIPLGSLLTFVDWYLDRRFLAEMLWGSDAALEIMPTFNIVRLVVSVIGVLVALGLLVATFLGADWARIGLAIACFAYAVVNIGAALSAAFMFVAGRGAFNSGADTTTTGTSILNGISLLIDVVLLLMVVVSAVILLSGKTKAYTKAKAGS